MKKLILLAIVALTIGTEAYADVTFVGTRKRVKLSETSSKLSCPAPASQECYTFLENGDIRIDGVDYQLTGIVGTDGSELSTDDVLAGAEVAHITVSNYDGE